MRGGVLGVRFVGDRHRVEERVRKPELLRIIKFRVFFRDISARVASSFGHRLLERFASGRAGEFVGEFLRRIQVELASPAAEESDGKNDVGVEDLPGRRIDAARADGEPGLRNAPTDRVVINVFRIPIVVVFLLTHFDGVVETGLLERAVPLQDAVAQNFAILVRSRFIEPENDRLFRQRLFRVGFQFFEVPTVDVTLEIAVRRQVANVANRRIKIPDALVGVTRFVPDVLQTADRIVNINRNAAVVDDGIARTGPPGVSRFDFDFNVVFEPLDRLPARTFSSERKPDQRFRRNVRELVAHEQIRNVDDVAPLRPASDDRQTENDAVGESDLQRFGVRPLVRAVTVVATQELDAVADLAEAPDHVVAEVPGLTAVQRRLADPAGDRDNHNIVDVELSRRDFPIKTLFLRVSRDRPAKTRRARSDRFKRAELGRSRGESLVGNDRLSRFDPFAGVRSRHVRFADDRRFRDRDRRRVVGPSRRADAEN